MARRSKSSIDVGVAVVKAQLEILERREVEFQKLIDDMQQLKNSISEEKGLLEVKVRALEAERFPVNWLPTELLIDIFMDLIIAESTRADDVESGFDAKTRHPGPIIVSHVCQRWRNIALDTPQLWSRLSYRGASWNEGSRHTFLERSKTAPLDILYWCSTDVSSFGEHQRISSLFHDLCNELERIQSIALECQGPEAVQHVITLLNNPLNVFSELQSLNLSIVRPEPHFTNARSLLRENGPGFRAPADGSEQHEIPSWSNLRHLKLQEIPLFNLPSHFLANLTSLVLSYPPKKRRNQVHIYPLFLSTLCQFLTFTPRLEDLSLHNTAPHLNAILHEDIGSTIDPGSLRRSRVELSYLKRFDWSYPCTGDVHHVMTFLNTPALEKLDLWVEESQARRLVEVEHTSWYQVSFASLASAIRSGHDLPSLRQLSLQCASEEGVSYAVRKFKLPVLEKLEIINTDARVRAGSAPLPALPGLDSIFRDPRLPHLTHITLSHFDISSSEHGKPQTMLGYLPVLVSLSLDTCVGVGEMMTRLQEKAVGAERLPSGTLHSKHGVRFCPRLEALSFWSCEDLEIGSVCAVVKARNRYLGGLREDHCDSADVEPRGDNSGGKRNLQGHGNRKADEAVSQREIRPLRKTRRQGPGIVDRGSGLTASSAVLTPSANILTSIIATEEAFRPASVVYIRFEDCPFITQEDVLKLRDLHVVDVIFNGSDSVI